MTRPLPLACAALLALAACSAPEAPQATATPMAAPATPTPPMVVHVALPEEPDPEVSAWADALTDAIASGQGGLTLAATPEEARAVVRIESVEKGTGADPEPGGEGEVHVMRFALVVGESTRQLNVVYRGDARPQAEALARNLRRAAEQVANGSAAGPTAESAEASEEDAPGSEPEDDPADVEDEG